MCIICKEQKPQTEYYKWSRKNKIEISTQCKKCYNESRRSKKQEKLKQLKMNEPQEYQELLFKKREYYHSRGTKLKLYDQARRRAQNKNIECTITPEDIIVPEYCPIFTWIKLGTDEHCNLPTLDRIDNTKGYIKENIQVISMKANRIKNNSTLQELIILVEYMSKL